MVVESVVVVGDKITPLSSDVPLQFVPFVTTPVGAYFFSSWSWGGGVNIDYPKAIFSRLPSLSGDRALGWTDVQQKLCPKAIWRKYFQRQFFFFGKGTSCRCRFVFRMSCGSVCLCVGVDTGISLFALWLGSWNFQCFFELVAPGGGSEERMCCWLGHWPWIRWYMEYENTKW